MLATTPQTETTYPIPVELVDNLRNSGTLPDLWGDGGDLVIADDDFLKVVGDGPLFSDDSNTGPADTPLL